MKVSPEVFPNDTNLLTYYLLKIECRTAVATGSMGTGTAPGIPESCVQAGKSTIGSVDNAKGALLEKVKKLGARWRVEFHTSEAGVVVGASTVFHSEARLLEAHVANAGAEAGLGVAGDGTEAEAEEKTREEGVEEGWREVALSSGSGATKKAAEKHAATTLLGRLQDGGDLSALLRDSEPPKPASSGEYGVAMGMGMEAR